MADTMTGLEHASGRGAIQPGFYRMSFRHMSWRELARFGNGFLKFFIVLLWRLQDRDAGGRTWLPVRTRENRTSIDEVPEACRKAITHVRDGLALELREIAWVMDKKRIHGAHKTVGAGLYLSDGKYTVISMASVSIPASKVEHLRTGRLTFCCMSYASDASSHFWSRTTSCRRLSASSRTKIEVMPGATPSEIYQRHLQRIADEVSLAPTYDSERVLDMIDAQLDFSFLEKIDRGLYILSETTAGDYGR